MFVNEKAILASTENFESMKTPIKRYPDEDDEAYERRVFNHLRRIFHVKRYDNPDASFHNPHGLASVL